MKNQEPKKSYSRNFYLPKEDILKLERIVQRGENWRERQRAQTLLVLHETKSDRQTAERIGIHEKTVGATRRDWFSRGYESLVDRPRPGAPRKINEEQQAHIVEHARQTPSTARELLADHVESGGENVHLNTIKNIVKAAGLVWKRTRHSLKKNATSSSSGKPSKRSSR